MAFTRVYIYMLVHPPLTCVDLGVHINVGRNSEQTFRQGFAPTVPQGSVEWFSFLVAFRAASELCYREVGLSAG